MSTYLFESKQHAELYAKYRPTYPDEVFKTIFKHCITMSKCSLETGKKLPLAIDVGCGNGQSSAPLLQYFDHVIGLDVSEKQIEQAKLKVKGVEFRTGPAENLAFLESESVDLVHVATAFHWMNAEEFYNEATRVLKPGGSLVIYSYSYCTLDNKEADELLNQNFRENLLGSYWNEKRHHIQTKYKYITLPFPDWYRNDNLQFKVEWSVDALIGFLSSWSSWQTFNKLHPGNCELEELHRRLTHIYTDKVNNSLKTVTATWPIFMLLGSKPCLKN